mgnify:CR=1 FL=1
MYEDIKTCPEELLLFFHHVPYTYRLKTGKTLIQHIYDSHFEGAMPAGISCSAEITPVTPGICRICCNVTLSSLLPYQRSVISIFFPPILVPQNPFPAPCSRMPDGSNALAYDKKVIEGIRPEDMFERIESASGGFILPGWEPNRKDEMLFFRF